MQQYLQKQYLPFSMRWILLIFIAAFCIPAPATGQVYLEPFAGYQKDLNNPGFHLLNTGLQLAYKKGRHYELIFQLQKSWPGARRSNDSSFTLNPALPLYTTAAKKISPAAYTAGVGHRLKILGRKTNNSVFVKIYTGVVYQHLAVDYQYDRTNYTILNPDKTLNGAGLFLSGGLEYMRQLGAGRLLAELNFSTPPLTGKRSYPYSFNFMAPFSINIGYSILLKNR